MHRVTGSHGDLRGADCFVAKCEWRGWLLGPKDDFPVPEREDACLWIELLVARKKGKRHWLEQRRDSENS